jgi:hypothetical protein
MTGCDVTQGPCEALTLSGVMEDLARRGFTEHFTMTGSRLRAVGRAGTFGADQVAIAEYYRFEGISDPDDMSILYALETQSGLRGTLADAFGVYSDPVVTDFIEDVRVRCRNDSHPEGGFGNLITGRREP